MKCAVSDFDRTLYVEQMIGEEDKNAVLNWQKSGNGISSIALSAKYK